MSARFPATLLMIEDDAIVRRNTCAYLEDSGFRVLQASDGREGLRLFHTERPDVVLTDLRMPEVEGLEIIRAVHAEQPETPVIVVSGTGNLEDALEAVRRGAWDYVSKPISDLAALELTVNRALERARLLSENRLYQLHLEQVVQERTADLRDAHHKLSATLQAIPDVWFEFDQAGRIYDYHAPTRGGPHYAPAERLMGHLVSEVLPAAASQVVLQALDQAARQGWHRGAVYTLDLPTGKATFELSIAAKGNTDEGQLRFIASARDITERRQAEELIQAQYQQLQAQHEALVGQEKLLREAEAQLRQANLKLEQRVADRTAELSLANAALARAARLKDEFLANMSHELRTPLTAILGLSESLQSGIYGPLDARQARAAQTIMQSGEHLLALINDILDLAKMEAGKLELQLAPIVVEEICQASLSMIYEMAHRKQLRVTFRMDEAATVVQGDGRRLRQMLVNLLSNAVKFTPEGGALGLDVQGDADRSAVRFTVWDTGIGIAPENQGQLFKPFVQLDTGLSRPNNGTGLGLSLVARMAELHGGSVAVESTGVPGKGSRFTIVLPWAERPEPGGCSSSPYAATQHRALVIEASMPQAQYLGRCLAELSYASRIFSQSTGILEQVLDLAPHVILLDLSLPGRTGWVVLEELKSDARTRAIPVLITSDEDDSERSRAQGAAGFLGKPVTRADLQRALSDLFGPSLGPAAAPPQTDKASAGPMILVADDNETTRVTLREYLQSQGYQVQTAEQGAEALERAHQIHPALILMDVQMPEVDGLEATRRLRASQDPELAEVPIIALTALTMAGDREHCLAAGMTDYLSKPVSLRLLCDVIRTQLARHELRP